MNITMAIVIRGDFSESEFGQLVALIREMDARRPAANFEMATVDPDRQQSNNPPEWVRFLRD